MLDRYAILIAAWADYRRIFAGERFNRSHFGNCLRQAWYDAKEAAALTVRFAMQDAAKVAARAAEPVAFEMNEAIDATKYLPAHMSQTHAIEEIRSRYASAA